MNSQTTQHQNNWDERYRQQDTPWENGLYKQDLLRLFSAYTAKNQAVLEIGCGLGTNALRLTQEGYHVTATDISAEAIQQAKQKAKLENTNVTFMQLDFLHEYQKLPHFPVVFDCAVFHLFKEKNVRQKFVNGVAHICEEQGFWLNFSCSKDQAEEIEQQTGVKAPPTISMQEMIEVIEPTFEIIDMRLCTFTITRPQGKADFNAWASAFKKR